MTVNEEAPIQQLIQASRRIQLALRITAGTWLAALVIAIIQQIMISTKQGGQLPLIFAIFIEACLVIATGGTLIMFARRQKIVQRVWHILPEDQLRSVAKVADPITGVTDLGTHYLVTAPLASITIAKDSTQIEIDPAATQSTYRQQSSYFNAHHLERWLQPVGVDAKTFLAALPDDRYEALVDADHQTDILHLTTADYDRLQKAAEK